MRQARSTFATEPGPRTCGRDTPTGASRASAARSRTSAPPRSGQRSSLPQPRAKGPLSRSPRDYELQSRRRRHLRGELRARPEPRLAAVRLGAGAPHDRRRPVARRREQPPGARPRRGVRLPRREGADEAAAAAPSACKASRTIVTLSLSTISTLNAPLAQDLDAHAAAGFDAIGLWEFKLPDDDASNVAALRDAGLSVSNCIPSVPSFLQLAIPGLEGPSDPEERLDAICASIRRLAAYDPECVLCLSGPLGGRYEAKGQEIGGDAVRRA